MASGLVDLRLMLQKLLIEIARDILLEREPELRNEFDKLFDVTVDTEHDVRLMSRVFLVRFTWGPQRIGEWQFHLDSTYDMRKDIAAFRPMAHNAMSGTLSVIANVQRARLERLFPGRIKAVELWVSPEKDQRWFKVLFNNGHVLEPKESEINTDLFIAQCSMIYDLPTL